MVKSKRFTYHYESVKQGASPPVFLLSIRKIPLVYPMTITYLWGSPKRLTMALIKTGSAVAAISGKIGGTVYSRNRYGAIARNWSKPTNPNSTGQTQARNIMGQIASAWRALSDDQRAGWNEAAMSGNWTTVNRLGETVKLSGQALYQMLNSNLINKGLAGLSAATIPAVPTEFPSIPLDVDIVPSWEGAGAPGNQFELTGLPNLSAPFQYVFDMSSPLSAGRNYTNKSNYRFIAVGPQTVDPAGLWIAYANRFGEPVPGQTIFVRVSILRITSGEQSPFVQFKTTVIDANP